MDSYYVNVVVCEKERKVEKTFRGAVIEMGRKGNFLQPKIEGLNPEDLISWRRSQEIRMQHYNFIQSGRRRERITRVWFYSSFVGVRPLLEGKAYRLIRLN